MPQPRITSLRKLAAVAASDIPGRRPGCHGLGSNAVFQEIASGWT